MSQVRIPPLRVTRFPGSNPAPSARPSSPSKVAVKVAVTADPPADGPMASVQGTSYAYNPVTSDPLDDAGLQKALTEIGAGVTFTDADFANGVDFVTKTEDGITATAIYDPLTHGITAWGTDAKGDVMIENAVGLATSFVHFAVTDEGQFKGAAVADGNDATTYALGYAPDGAVVQSQVEASVTGDSSPTASDAISITLVGDRQAVAEGTGQAMASRSSAAMTSGIA